MRLVSEAETIHKTATANTHPSCRPVCSGVEGQCLTVETLGKPSCDAAVCLYGAGCFVEANTGRNSMIKFGRSLSAPVETTPVF